MGESHADTRVLLIGGTSHAGKSTLAQAIAERLGWQYRSTDKLARHPGRPWAPEGGAVPDHVADHYRSLSVDELLADVLCHYAGNVWPLARALIATHAQDATEPCLVLEGSALWPELVATLRVDAVQSIWLAVSPQLVEARIHQESRRDSRSSSERLLIDQFVRRSKLYDEHMRRALARLELTSIEVDTVASINALTDTCLRHVRLGCEEA